MLSAMFSVLLLASDPAAGTTTPPAPAAAEETKKERQICKREPVSGSQYRTKRVCMTAAEWKARARGQGIDDLSDVSTKAAQ